MERLLFRLGRTGRSSLCADRSMPNVEFPAAAAMDVKNENIAILSGNGRGDKV